MNKTKKIITTLSLIGRSNFGLIASSGALVFSILLACGFFLFKKTAYFDDSFIYLHMAANIVEMGTARYFPIADSGMLLASSPLRLLTLVPGFLILEIFNIPLRTIEAARFAFLCSGFVAFLFFLPFWTNRIRNYLLLGTAFFLLSASLDTLFLMEGGVLFLSLFTLIKLLNERTENHFAIGVAVLLVGLSRPEIGVVAVISTVLIYFYQPKVLTRIMLGLAVGFLAYSALMLALGVYPIPSTIWSKQITGKLKLFTDKNLIEILPMNIAQIIGLSWSWAGWILIGLPAAFSLALSRGAIPVLSALSLLLIIAISMPGNFVWYSENFLIVLFAIIAAVAIEIHRKHMSKIAIPLGLILILTFSLTLFANFGKNKNYPWNENSPGYLAYQEVGQSSVGDGKYVINRYSSEPVRIRMCEIGIVSFFSGPNSWIYDVCGLIQIGNLKGASQSWLRHFYPYSFRETGDDQLMRFKDNQTTHVIDVWALRSKEEAAGAVGKCKFVDDRLCINEYK
ncbi:hypothetical protein QZN00_29730 [Burkholderia multivorans]|nr:hypothetical protein [Burkholderia multivorans]